MEKSERKLIMNKEKLGHQMGEYWRMAYQFKRFRDIRRYHTRVEDHKSIR